MLPSRDQFSFRRKIEEVLTSYWKRLPQGTAIIVIPKDDVPKLGIWVGERNIVGDEKTPGGEGFELKGHLLDAEEVKMYLHNGFFEKGHFFIVELDSAKVSEAKGHRKPTAQAKAVES